MIKDGSDLVARGPVTSQRILVSSRGPTLRSDCRVPSSPQSHKYPAESLYQSPRRTVVQCGEPSFQATLSTYCLADVGDCPMDESLS